MGCSSSGDFVASCLQSAIRLDPALETPLEVTCLYCVLMFGGHSPHLYL